MFDVRHEDWNKPREACVYILESPTSTDLLRECQEGRALQAALFQARIPCRYYLATDKASFLQALGYIAQQRKRDNQMIALHISCHGNNEGIALTSQEFIQWSELRTMLFDFSRDANAYHEGTGNTTVLLCMSACNGIAAVSMATNEGCPFLALVATNEKVLWSDCLVSFLAFYNRFILKRAPIGEAVDAMNVAAGVNQLFHVLDKSKKLLSVLNVAPTNSDS